MVLQELAEQHLSKAIALDPDSAAAAIELGNFALQRHQTEQALHWYELARKDVAAEDTDLLPDIERQIQSVRADTSGTAVPMRNPMKE